MTTYIIESGTETGTAIRYLGGKTWVSDSADADRFEDFEEAEQAANNWQDFFAMRGAQRYTNITEAVI